MANDVLENRFNSLIHLLTHTVENVSARDEVKGVQLFILDHQRKVIINYLDTIKLTQTPIGDKLCVLSAIHSAIVLGLYGFVDPSQLTNIVSEVGRATAAKARAEKGNKENPAIARRREIIKGHYHGKLRKSDACAKAIIKSCENEFKKYKINTPKARTIISDIDAILIELHEKRMKPL